jgi:Pex2 / Pex12 amino terminal region
MMDYAVNPAIPTTTGALLAEEWTINPLATLPSFLEMFMMDEASRSARKSLQAGMTLLQQKLAEQATQSRRSNNNNSTVSLLQWLQIQSGQWADTMSRLLQCCGPEFSCLILFLLERHCLRSEACATISESLYGGRLAKMDRSAISTDKNDNRRKLLPLSDTDRNRMALLVALGPYVRHRLWLCYQKLQQTQPTSQRLWKKLHKLFLYVYPLLHVSISSIELVYQWRYMLGHSVFFHPSAHLLGLVVRRVTQEDSQKSAPTGATQQPQNAAMPSTAKPSAMRQTAVWAMSSAVVLSWISHLRSEYQRQRQALIMEQQQQQQGNNTQLHSYNHPSIMDSSLPPPPSNPIKISMPSHLCPLCRQPRVHPTASPAGFVFCYKCLLQHVQQTGQCPVTGRSCKEAQLLRLYEPNHSTN